MGVQDQECGEEMVVGDSWLHCTPLWNPLLLHYTVHWSALESTALCTGEQCVALGRGKPVYSRDESVVL